MRSLDKDESISAQNAPVHDLDQSASQSAERKAAPSLTGRASKFPLLLHLELGCEPRAGETEVEEWRDRDGRVVGGVTGSPTTAQGARQDPKS